MKLNLLLLMLVVIVGVVGGCSEKQVPVSELAVQNVRRAIQALTTNASVKVIKESYGVRTNMAFVIDKEMRLALIRDWENRIYRYIQCAGAAAILQQETKGDRQWLDFFIKSGIKLKQACFSVSWEARRKDETADEYRRRKSAAENLYNTYEQEVALWRCYKGTGGKSLLQPEIREEFIRQSESLFDYPSRNELLK